MNKGTFGFPQINKDESFHGFPKRKGSGESFYGFPQNTEIFDFKFLITTPNTTRTIWLSTIEDNTPMILDWGDGGTSNVVIRKNAGYTGGDAIGYSWSSFTHTYQQVGTYNFRFIGDTLLLNKIYVGLQDVVDITKDGTRFSNIEELNLAQSTAMLSQPPHGFPDVSTWTKLTALRTSRFWCYTDMPSFNHCKNLVYFEALYCWNNAPIVEFTDMPFLKNVYLAPGVTNSIKTQLYEFVNCPELSAFQLGYLATGSLPSFNNNTKLTSLTISNCGFSGTLPSFSNCTLLSSFSINGNQFTGNLPSFSTCVSLVSFTCFNNKFSGKIPTFINCTSLQTLNLALNDWSGIIPYPPQSIVTYNIGQNKTQPIEVPIDIVDNKPKLITFSTYNSKITGSRTIPNLNSNANYQNIQFSDSSVTNTYYNNGVLTLRTNNLLVGMFNYCTGITVDFSNLTTSNAINTQFKFIGNNLNVIYPLGDKIKSQVIHLGNNIISVANMDVTISNMFTYRNNFNNTLAKTLSIAGTNSAPSGTYQMPSGFTHDLNEAQIDALTTTVKEKIWILVNCQVSSVNTTKRYKWTITTN